MLPNLSHATADSTPSNWASMASRAAPARPHLEIVLVQLAHERGERLCSRDAHDALGEHLPERRCVFVAAGDHLTGVGHDERQDAFDALPRRLADDRLDRALRRKVHEHGPVDQRHRRRGDPVEQARDVPLAVELDGNGARLERARERGGRAARARQALRRPGRRGQSRSRRSRTMNSARCSTDDSSPCPSLIVVTRPPSDGCREFDGHRRDRRRRTRSRSRPGPRTPPRCRAGSSGRRSAVRRASCRSAGGAVGRTSRGPTRAA